MDVFKGKLHDKGKVLVKEFEFTLTLLRDLKNYLCFLIHFDQNQSTKISNMANIYYFFRIFKIK